VIKVKKIYLRRGYTPVDKRIFIPNKATQFDCYIQRFNGFALWVAKGTIIDEKLMHSIQKSTAQLFIDNHDSENYFDLAKKLSSPKRFELEPINLDEAIQEVLGLEGALESLPTPTTQLEAIYNKSKNLIEAWSRAHSQPLPLNAFYKIAQLIVGQNKKKPISFSCFNSFLDDFYLLSAHMTKVAFFASIIGAKLRLHVTDQEKLVLAALMHDTGTAGIEEGLIEKPEKLTPEEYKSIQTHVDESMIIAKQCGIRDRAILDGIGEHHERLDGSGYPNGLTASEISQFGKILGVCDVFDALITKPIKKPFNFCSPLRKRATSLGLASSISCTILPITATSRCCIKFSSLASAFGAFSGCKSMAGKSC